MLARLLRSVEIAPEIRHFEFEVPAVASLEFTPGQFVSFTEMLRGKPITRAYSVASAPHGNRFELCLNRVKEGHFSPHLFAMQPGDTVDMKGPLGTFTLRDPHADALFIATGTGIAPMRAILQARLAAGNAPRYRLLFGVRYEASVLYREEFDEMARTHPAFEFWPTLTRPEAGWTGLRGRVQAHLDAALSPAPPAHVYLCGLKEMVDDVRQLLKARGFDRRQIVYEKYD